MKNEHIFLVLDDLFEDRFFLCQLLRASYGAVHIEEFVFSEDAFAFLKTLDPGHHVSAFVDVNLPKSDGFEFVDMCYDQIFNHRGRAADFIMVSSVFAPDQLSRLAADPRIRGYVTKPVLPDALNDLVRLAVS